VEHESPPDLVSSLINGTPKLLIIAAIGCQACSATRFRV
jgi:hypothetical protein